MDRVFEPFYRREPSRSRETGGIGLGLAVVRSVARAHGGDADLRALHKLASPTLSVGLHLTLNAGQPLSAAAAVLFTPKAWRARAAAAVGDLVFFSCLRNLEMCLFFT